MIAIVRKGLKKRDRCEAPSSGWAVSATSAANVVVDGIFIGLVSLVGVVTTTTIVRWNKLIRIRVFLKKISRGLRFIAQDSRLRNFVKHRLPASG